MHRLRLFAVPIWVAIGILVSIGVYQTLLGKQFDSEILNAPNLMSETIQHVYLSGISFALVAAIGVPVGVAIAQAGRAVRVPVFLIANLGQAVPGIGLLVLLFAILGLGVAPTVIALVVYGLLPVLRNTVAGIQGVDPAAVDAARGNGHDALAGFGASAVASCLPVGVCRPAHSTRPNHRNRYTRELHRRRRPRGRDRRRHQHTAIEWCSSGP